MLCSCHNETILVVVKIRYIQRESLRVGFAENRVGLLEADSLFGF